MKNSNLGLILWQFIFTICFIFAGLLAAFNIIYYFLFGIWGVLSFYVYVKLLRKSWEDEKNE